MPGTYYIPQAIAEQGVKAVHPYPFCANEDSHIVGRFDAATAWAPSRSWNFRHHTATSPSSLMSTRPRALTMRRVSRGGAVILPLPRTGWWSTRAPGRRVGVLGASTVSMPWKYP